MNNNIKHEVVIIGAGPTGLMTACQLARLGVKFRIIEKNSGPNNQSRALAIHAGSMEIFSQMGIVHQFLSQGVKVQAVNYMVKGKVQKRIPLSSFGKGLTEFPFLLVVEQSKTERILAEFLEKLGCHVEWQTELIDFAQDDQSVHVTIKKFGREAESLDIDWLVAADGAKSTARQKLDIPFGGQTYPMDLFVLDCKVDWQFQSDELYVAFSDYSFAGFFPMPEGRCRIIGFVPDDAKTKDNVTFEEVSNGFAKRMQTDIHLSDPHWISMYRSHHRYVSQFKIERCFLAGDAAHIHSPVGAQGMNTGLQDAFNLAWKLAFAIQDKASKDLLDTYQEERLPFARQLVRTTDKAFNVTVSANLVVKYVRMYIAPLFLAAILKIKFLERFIFKTISQIGISYADSRLSHNSSKNAFPAASPKPGQRLPYVEYENVSGKRVNIQHQINGLSLRLLIFSGASSNGDHEVSRIAEKYGDTITIEQIPFTPGTALLYKILGIKKTGFYLIRPDLYIAYRSNCLVPGSLQKYLNSFLIDSRT